MICAYTQLIIVRWNSFLCIGIPVQCGFSQHLHQASWPVFLQIGYLFCQGNILSALSSTFSCIFSVYSHFPQNRISYFLASSKPTWFGGLSHASQYSLFISNISWADFFFLFKQITKDQSWKKSFSHIETGYTRNPLTNKYEG